MSRIDLHIIFFLLDKDLPIYEIIDKKIDWDEYHSILPIFPME